MEMRHFQNERQNTAQVMIFQQANGWKIQYKDGFLWHDVINHRTASFEPEETAYYSSKQEVANEMAKLIAHYS